MRLLVLAAVVLALAPVVLADGDTRPPITSRTYSGQTWYDGTKVWIGAQTKVLLPAADDTGVAATYYVLDGGDAQVYAGPLAAPTPSGTHTLTVWSVDLAGNVEPAHSYLIHVDADAPTAAVTSPVQGTTYDLTFMGQVESTRDETRWREMPGLVVPSGPFYVESELPVARGGVYVDVEAHDALTGVARLEFHPATGWPEQRHGSGTFVWHFGVETFETTQQAKVLVRDRVGNTATLVTVVDVRCPLLSGAAKCL